jgi:hypothetical protein
MSRGHFVENRRVSKRSLFRFKTRGRFCCLNRLGGTDLAPFGISHRELLRHPLGPFQTRFLSFLGVLILPRTSNCLIFIKDDQKNFQNFRKISEIGTNHHLYRDL